MFEEEYEQLFEGEKEEFKRICNYLLSKTFILRDIYDRQQKRMIKSPEYIFVENNFSLFEKYLSYAGWQLINDAQNGIYSVSNIYGYNVAKFDQYTTYLLLALMVIYEEQPPQINLGNSIVTTVQDVNKTMQLLNMLLKKPTKEATRMAYRRLEQFNLVLRLNTSQDVEDWKIMILPTIKKIISYDKIKELCDEHIPLILKEKYETNDEQENDESIIEPNQVGGEIE